MLAAPGGAERDQAWHEFVAAHTGLLIHTCRTIARDRDAAMDGYAFILEALRENDCRRLRAYVPDGRTRFTTWLVVVARRLLLDHHRRRYGRPRSDDEPARAEHLARRRLRDLVPADTSPDAIPAPSANAPDADVRRQELSTALLGAVNELSSADRSLLAMRFEKGLTVREIASATEAPTVFHVYRRLERALGSLRHALARRGVVDREP